MGLIDEVERIVPALQAACENVQRQVATVCTERDGLKRMGVEPDRYERDLLITLAPPLERLAKLASRMAAQARQA